ncbi:MAG: DNA replication/repair protein RecF [Alphaproteobacteria bacterium]|nr:DNA replication/repair protein RecF [Alphaproteobacteria bacterium]
MLLAEVSVAAKGRQLAVTRLQLTQFRCYRDARLDVASHPVVLTGPNGAGKTNLLEAISFLAPGRGLRRARLGEIDRRGSPEPAAAWAVSAALATPRGTVRIGTGREASPSGVERRIVRIDGVPARSQTALAEHVNLVWLTPQMDRLLLEGAGPRRRFLDRLVYGFDPDHAGRCAAYDQAMRERGKLLREGPQDAAWLSALEESMARHGIAIVAARREVAARLDAACTAAVAGFPCAMLELAGTVEEWLQEMPALAAEERLLQRLGAGRRHDAESGGAAVGPHRSDLRVRHGATQAPAEQCSTGEQKALLIAILLAHARLQAALWGAAPIMLLDEVAAHLDRARRRALFAELGALGVQSWMTGTEAELFADLRGAAQFLTVDDAVIAAA